MTQLAKKFRKELNSNRDMSLSFKLTAKGIYPHYISAVRVMECIIPPPLFEEFRASKCINKRRRLEKGREGSYIIRVLQVTLEQHLN
jgi:hypothetical protein